jgi:hypothetical protein
VQQSGAGARAGKADRPKASFAACFTFGGLRYANPPYTLGAQEVNCDGCTCPFAAARSRAVLSADACFLMASRTRYVHSEFFRFCPNCDIGQPNLL